MTGRDRREPRIARLGCIHATGATTGGDLVPLPCGGRVDLATLLWPLALGSDGVLLLGCSPGECRHRCQDGDPEASGAEVVSRARALIAGLGLSPGRIARRSLGRHDDPAELIREFSRTAIAPLGSWVKQELPRPSASPEAMGVDRGLRLLAHIQAARGPAPAPKLTGGDLLWPGCNDLRLELAQAGGGPGAALELWGRGGARAVAPPRCCGLPLLRAGETAAFVALARDNAELIAASGAERLVVACADCAETMARVYDEAGVRLKVPVIDLAAWTEDQTFIRRSSSFRSRRRTDQGRLSARSRRRTDQGRLSAFAEATADERANLGGSPVALAVPHAPGPWLRAVSERLRGSSAVIHLEEPWVGDPPEGPALRRAITELAREAAGSGAAALALLRPHLATTARLALAPGGWQTGPEIPILDLNEALLGLVGPRGASGEVTEGQRHGG